MYKKRFKRLFDLVFVVSTCFITLPIFIILLVVLTLCNKGTPFFFQLRPGKNGKIFRLIKFKTMTDKKGDDGTLLPDRFRIHKIGSIVRKFSLDEIPQLYNVLCGQMSIIGPRPLLPEYLLLYNHFQNRRHEVKPGITGWAQVNGRNLLSWDEKFKFDVWYVDNLSFGLDLRIFIMTLGNLIKPSGVNSSSEVTMEPFNGNE